MKQAGNFTYPGLFPFGTGSCGKGMGMTMIRVGLCDDEPVLLAKLNKFVSGCYAENQIFAKVCPFENGQALLYEIEDGAVFDLLLLDIEMPGMDGMALAGRAKKFLPNVLIIFITSHMEYVLDAYELSVFRYVPKADPGLRLTHALLDAAAMIDIQLRESYVIQNQNRLERIPLQNLLYITHEGKNALLITDLPDDSTEKNTCCRVRRSLQQVYEELDGEQFLFIDRGCIVNLSKIMSIRDHYALLKDGTRLPVSQSRLPALKEKLLEFWKRHI